MKHAFLAQHGKRVDKWEQYLPAYERELAGLIGLEQPLRLLEVGVQNGGSLEVWSRVLPEGSTIVGLDVNPAVAALVFEHPAIAVHVADATDPDALCAALGEARFDIIIDDGSHRSPDVIAALALLMPRLEPGGLYIVEDLHASYWAGWQGGLFAPDSAIAHLKEMVDILHADHVEDGDRQPGLIDRLVEANRWLARLTFYDSIAFIERLPAEKDRPYRRIVSGAGTEVDANTMWSPGWPVALLDNVRFGDEALQTVQATLLAEVEELRLEAASLRSALHAATATPAAADVPQANDTDASAPSP